MDAVFLALAAGFMFGALGPALRHGLEVVRDAELGAFHSVAIGLLVAAVVAAAAGQLDDLGPSDVWPFIAIGVFVPGISQVLFVRAIRDIGASRTIIITAVAPLLAGLAAIAFLDEPLRLGLLLGAMLVVVGAMTLAWERTRPAGWQPVGVIWALSGVVLFAVRDTTARWVIGERDVPGIAAAVYLFLGATIAMLGYLLFTRSGRHPLRQVRRTVRPFVLAGVVFGAGYCLLFEAFERGKVTVVSPLNATYALWGVVLSALVMRKAEAVTPRVALAAVLIVAGTAAVAATR
jgi:drug/metabolite transporter (DMT)-like permease